MTAEIGAGLIGFAGIIRALQGDSALPAPVRNLLVLLFATSCSALFFALAALLIVPQFESPLTGWRYLNGAGAIVNALATTFFFVALLRKQIDLPLVVCVPILIAAVVTTAANGAVGLGYFPQHAEFFIAAVMFHVTACSVVMFATYILRSGEPR